MHENGIGVSELPDLVSSEHAARGWTLNIMVAGSHGLGKTTFLNMFLGSELLKHNPFHPDNGNPYWHIEALCNIQTSSVEISECGFVVKLNITEIDCIGDHTNNTGCHEPIIELLETSFNDYSDRLKETTRKMIDDKRIHVCIYFLEPLSTVKRPDIEVLRKIADYCTVIPVIAKADLLSSKQTIAIKQHIRDILETNNIPFYEDRHALAEAPFLMFCHAGGDKTMADAGTYAWSEDPNKTYETNDFYTLRRLILEKNTVSLIQDTEQYYDSYRISRLMSADRDSQEKNMLQKKIDEYASKIKQAKERLREERVRNKSACPQ